MIRIIAESVGHNVWPDSVRTRIDAEVGATAIVSHTLIDSVRANPTVEFTVVHNATVDNLLERRTARSESNASRNVESQHPICGDQHQ